MSVPMVDDYGRRIPRLVDTDEAFGLLRDAVTAHQATPPTLLDRLRVETKGDGRTVFRLMPRDCWEGGDR